MYRIPDGRKLALLAAASLATLGGTAATATASPVTLNYSCVLPYVAEQPATATIDLDYPSNVPVNQFIPGPLGSTTLSLNGDSRVMFEVIGAVTIEGVHRTSLVMNGGGVNLPLTVPQSFGPTPLSYDGATSPVVLPGSGTVPQIKFSQNGQVTLTAGNIRSTLLARTETSEIIFVDEEAGGANDDPNTFDVLCTQLPGQAATVDTFTVGTVANLPTISNILPRNVKANKKTTIVITGTKLKQATAVKIGGVNAVSFRAINNRAIQAKVPALAAGSYPVTVTTPGGTNVASSQATITYKN